MKKDTLFWDVDTQFDFMKPEGALYVPGAVDIIATVSDIRKSALDSGFSMMADVDWHTSDDGEIAENPDMKETFPPHCMAGQPGSERVGYLGHVPIDCVDVDETDTSHLSTLVRKDPFHIVIRKQSLDVFDNPNTNKLVGLIKPKHVYVFGVALDFCVYYVLRGLSNHPGVELTLLKDATKGLQARRDEDVYDELKRMGVEITDFEKIRRRL